MATDDEPLMTSDEVGALFRVNGGTVSRWATAGRFPAGVVVRTLGGQYRFRRAGIVAMLDEGTEGEVHE